MLNDEELVKEFEAVGAEAIAAQKRFSMTKDWFLIALEKGPVTAIEARASNDELTRRMDEINKLEASMEIKPPYTDEMFMAQLELMRNIVKKIDEMQEWILNEADRLVLPQ